MKKINLIVIFWLVLIAATPAYSQFAADVIIVVDSSVSMVDEAEAVQQALNDFSNSLQGEPVDLHVIVIAGDSTDVSGICAPAPLGSGMCPGDENLPGYRHVITSVGSGQVFQSILNTYAQWSDSLQPGATRTIIAVTDDDDEMSFTGFNSMLLALDSTFQDYRFHAIVADFVPLQLPPDPCESIAASPGTEYMDLIVLTGGLLNNLCDQDIAPGLSNMAQDIIAETVIELAPTANDDSATTPSNTPVIIDVAVNDTDVNNNLNAASAVVVSGPINGTADINGDGTFTYTPSPGFDGADVFTYEICDTTPIPLCDVATVTITVASNASVCNSTVTTIDGLKAEIDLLTTSYQTKKFLTRNLINVESALSNGNNKIARRKMANFINHVVNRSSLKETNMHRIPLDEANNLICGGAKVLIGIELP